MTPKEFGEGCAGLIMLGLIGFGFYACSGMKAENEAREAALAASTDPAQIAKLVLGPGTEAKADRIGDIVLVTYKLREGLTGSTMLFRFHQDVIALAPRIFSQVKGVDEIHFRANAELTDLRGNASTDLVAKLAVTRADNQKTNWSNVMPDNVPRIVEDYWVHPAMTR